MNFSESEILIDSLCLLSPGENDAIEGDWNDEDDEDFDDQLDTEADLAEIPADDDTDEPDPDDDDHLPDDDLQ